ncbi:unnamed protein product, partial [marine sediment metagenome]
TDKQKTFIKDLFNPEKVEDLTDEGIGKFVEEGKKKFAETAKLFGVKESSSNTKSENKANEEEGSMEDQALELIGAVDSDKS